MEGPVLIAGAGPVGLTAACALARLGVALRIVDKARARSETSKALVLWPRTLELLDVEGCVEPFIDAGLKGTGARIHANGRELVHVSLETARSPYNFALFLPQNETERLLEEQLGRHGVRVERGTTLEAFAESGKDVAATLLDAEGHREETRFAALLGCDGAHSTVRHGLGVPFEGLTETADFLLADVRIDGDLPTRELALFWQPDGILALFPIIGNRFRVIADTAPADTTAPPELEEIQRLLDARGPGGLKAHDPIWLSRFRINERKVKDYARGRVFLLGDAAHIHSPAGGQGMNTGMQDAFNLAWKLAMVLGGRAGTALLDSYSPERSAIGDQVLSNASRMTHVAILRNPILQEIRNLAAGMLGRIPALRQRLVDQLAELDLHYEASPLTGRGTSGHPAGGHRAPDVPLRSAEGKPTRLHALLRSGRFALLSVGVPGPDLPDDLADFVVRAEANGEAAYETGRHYLIRPDAYVATVADGGHSQKLLDHLRTMVGR